MKGGASDGRCREDDDRGGRQEFDAGDLADDPAGDQRAAAGQRQQLRRLRGYQLRDLALELIGLARQTADLPDDLAHDPHARSRLAAAEPAADTFQPLLAVKRARGICSSGQRSCR
jgi:hypothetical protein